MRTLFVGREQELREIEAALDGVSAGSGRVVLVTGEPGIGKTRVAEEIASRASSKASVAWGRSWDAEGTPAYYPWVQVLRALGCADVLESPTVGVDPERARFELFDAVAARLEAVSRVRPILIVLDDIHAADTSTLMLLAFVARDLQTTRALVVATARDTSHQPTTASAHLLAKVAREAIQVPLDRLGSADVAQWVRAALPTLVDRADDIFSTSEGNPLFVSELVAAARKRDAAAWTSANLLPRGIRGAIQEHLALLSAPARAIVEAASVLGRDFSLDAVRSMVATEDRDAIEEAMAAQIVSQVAGGSMRFAHGLLRDELYASIAPPRRSELHRLACAWFSGDAPAAAHHGLLGARAEDAREVVRIVIEAMLQAGTKLAYEDAAMLGERALAALPRPLAREHACELLAAVGEARIAGGDIAAGKAACARALDLAIEMGRGDLAARAALLYATEISIGRREPTVHVLRRALAALPPGDSSTKAEVMARLSVALVPARDEEGDEPARLGREAVAMARRLGDDTALFAPLRLATTFFPEAFAVRERVAVTAESLGMEQKLGQVPRVVPLLAGRISTLLEAGDIDSADAALGAAEMALRGIEKPHARWRAPLLRAMFAGLRGRFEEADTLGREVFDTCRKHDIADGLNHACIHRMMFQFNRGDDEGLLSLERIIAAAFGATPGAAIFFALADAIHGRADRAKALLDQAVRLELGQIPGGVNLGWACVEAGTVEHAELFYGLARAHQGTMLFGPGAMATLGPTALLRGRLASMLERAAEAETHYEAALSLARKLGAGPYEAQAELAWSEELAKRGAPGARPLAEAAFSRAERLAMPRVAARAKQILQGSIQPSPSPRALPKTTGVTLDRQGEMWALAGAGSSVLLKDAKGLAYLEALVRDQNREIHVLELVGAEVDGDAGPMLDAKAKQAYRERAEALREELDEATHNGDLGRVARARAELEALGEELSRAVGLGGRDRRAASTSERARVNVQRRLKDVIARVGAADSKLGRHLELSVRTGVFCRYGPTWE